jgi:hypothetical protein
MGAWQERLANALTQGDPSALPEVLVLLGALIGCSLFTLIQFFTMLGTRWGDKNPAPKSFVLSILVHVVILLAWSTALIIRPYPSLKALPSNKLTSIPIKELVEEEPEDQFDAGNTPVWQKLQDFPSPELTRQERPADEPVELTEAPRLPAESPTVDPVELADVSVQPQATATPDPVIAPHEMPIRATPVPSEPAAAETTAEARPEAGSSPAARRLPREADSSEISEELPKTRGSEEMKAPNRPEDLALSLPLDRAGESDENPVLAGRESETVRKGAAPTPSSAPDGEFTPDGRTNEDGKPSFSRARTFSRSKTRRPNEGPDIEGPLASRIPSDAKPGPEDLLLPSNGSSMTGADNKAVPKLSPGEGPNLPNRSPATYKLRKLEQRRGTALKHGGSLESEKAVENSLKWLASVQEPAGFWDASKHGGGAAKHDPQGNDRQKGGLYADTGVTGLALLAFMGAGYTATDGDYADNVDRGLKWLVSQQRSDGYLGGSATHFDQMYCHAIATFAIGEACGMLPEGERAPELRRALRLGVEYIVERQGSDGGWRYEKSQDGDMSMFGWQLMALKSADIAGVKAKPDVWAKMISFLKSRSLGEHSGLAGYNLHPSTRHPTPAMTAEALFCKQMIGIRRTNPACQEAVGYLLKHVPQITQYDEYYWYYGTMAMFQHGGDAWETWNSAQRDLILRLQETRGPNAGSWDPKGKWAGIGGRIYSTALATLCLEVYYRYLPLYRSGME